MQLWISLGLGGWGTAWSDVLYVPWDYFQAICLLCYVPSLPLFTGLIASSHDQTRREWDNLRQEERRDQLFLAWFELLHNVATLSVFTARLLLPLSLDVISFSPSYSLAVLWSLVASWHDLLLAWFELYLTPIPCCHFMWLVLALFYRVVAVTCSASWEEPTRPMFEYTQSIIGYEYDWTYASSTVSRHFGAEIKTVAQILGHLKRWPYQQEVLVHTCTHKLSICLHTSTKVHYSCKTLTGVHEAQGRRHLLCDHPHPFNCQLLGC